MMFHQRIFSTLVVLVWLCLGIFPNNATASHPGHASLAEIEWNPKSGNFEIALCVCPEDLQQVLSIAAGKPIRLELENEIDELLRAYVAKHFRILPNHRDDKKPLENDPQWGQIRWVGQEIDIERVWLYFELSGDSKLADWKISNEMFFELNPEQLNLIQFSAKGKSESFSLTRENRSIIIRQ